MNTTIESVLYTSKTLSNGQHPLMLRLTKNRKRKYISLHLSLDACHWDADKNRPKRNCPNRDQINRLIEQKKRELQEQVIDFKTNDKDYTLSSLVNKVAKPTIRQTVGEYIEAYRLQLIAEKRLGNARTFADLKASMTRFCHSLDFYFIDVDGDWLRRYESWLRTERKMSENSIGVRFRSLRVLYNRAIADNLVKKSSYPFGDYKVSQLKEATAKRAISKDDIRRLMDFDVNTLQQKGYYTPYLAMSKDLFLFSYFGCGINITDILHLTRSNILDGRVSFKRQKTGKLISFGLHDSAKEIIAKYADSSREHLFPVLSESATTPQQQYERVKKINKRINHYLKLIGEHLGLPIALTTYVARHTYATVLKRSGVNIAIISESLGHSDLATTQIYLDSFENSQIDEAMKHLL